MNARENKARMDTALAAAREAARLTAERARALAATEPLSAKGKGRIPGHLRDAPKVNPKVVVRAKVGTYRTPDGKIVRGNRAARRQAGQRGKP